MQQPRVFSTNLASIVPNEWIYASFSYDRHTSNVRMYVNDRELINTNNASIGNHTSYNEFFVGTNSTQTSYLDGSISTIDLYNTNIYYKHIKNHISNDTNYLNNVNGFWKLTSMELSPDSFLDVSGNSNDLSIHGVVEYTDTFPSFGTKTPLFNGDVASYLSSDMKQVSTNYFSVAVWFNPSVIKEGQWVLSKMGNFGLTMDIFGLPILQIENTRTSTYSFRRTLLDDGFVVPLINYRLEQQAHHPELTYTSIEFKLEPAFQSETPQVVTVASFSEQDSSIVFALPETTSSGGTEYTNYTWSVHMRLDDNVVQDDYHTLFSVHSKFTFTAQRTSENKIKVCVHQFVPASKPTITSVTTVSNQTNVVWTNGYDNDSVVISYDLVYTSGTTNVTTQDVTSPMTIIDLQHGVTYSFRINKNTTFCNQSQIVQSDVFQSTIQTPPADAASWIGVDVPYIQESVGSSTVFNITLYWDDGNNYGHTITYTIAYRLKITVDSAWTDIPITPSSVGTTSTMSHTISGIQRTSPFMYDFKVIKSYDTSTIVESTELYIDLTKIPTFDVLYVTGDSIHIYLNDVDSLDSTYELEYGIVTSDVSDAEVFTLIDLSNATSYNLKLIETSLSYVYETMPLTVTTMVLPLVDQLSSTIYATSINLVWSGGSGENSSMTFVQYVVEYKVDSQEWYDSTSINIYGIDNTQYLVTSLIENTVYDFRVHMEFSYEYIGTTHTVSVTSPEIQLTPIDPISPPEINSIEFTADTFTVTWTHSSFTSLTMIKLKYTDTSTNTLTEEDVPVTLTSYTVSVSGTMASEYDIQIVEHITGAQSASTILNIITALPAVPFRSVLINSVDIVYDTTFENTIDDSFTSYNLESTRIVGTTRDSAIMIKNSLPTTGEVVNTGVLELYYPGTGTSEVTYEFTQTITTTLVSGITKTTITLHNVKIDSFLMPSYYLGPSIGSDSLTLNWQHATMGAVTIDNVALSSNTIDSYTIITEVTTDDIYDDGGAPITWTAHSTENDVSSTTTSHVITGLDWLYSSGIKNAYKFTLSLTLSGSSTVVECASGMYTAPVLNTTYVYPLHNEIIAMYEWKSGNKFGVVDSFGVEVSPQTYSIEYADTTTSSWNTWVHADNAELTSLYNYVEYPNLEYLARFTDVKQYIRLSTLDVNKSYKIRIVSNNVHTVTSIYSNEFIIGQPANSAITYEPEYVVFELRTSNEKEWHNVGEIVLYDTLDSKISVLNVFLQNENFRYISFGRKNPNSIKDENFRTYLSWRTTSIDGNYNVHMTGDLMILQIPKNTSLSRIHIYSYIDEADIYVVSGDYVNVNIQYKITYGDQHVETNILTSEFPGVIDTTFSSFSDQENEIINSDYYLRADFMHLVFNSIVIKMKSVMDATGRVDWKQIQLFDTHGVPVAYDAFVNHAFELDSNSGPNAYASSYPNNPLHVDSERIIWNDQGASYPISKDQLTTTFSDTAFIDPITRPAFVDGTALLISDSTYTLPLYVEATIWLDGGSNGVGFQLFESGIDYRVGDGTAGNLAIIQKNGTRVFDDAIDEYVGRNRTMRIAVWIPDNERDTIFYLGDTSTLKTLYSSRFTGLAGSSKNIQFIWRYGREGSTISNVKIMNQNGGDTLVTLYPRFQVASMNLITFETDRTSHVDLEVSYQDNVYIIPSHQLTTHFKTFLIDKSLSDANFDYSSTTMIIYGTDGVLTTSGGMSHVLSKTEYTLPLYVECTVIPNHDSATTLLVTTDPLNTHINWSHEDSSENSILWGIANSRTYRRIISGVAESNDPEDSNVSNTSKFSMYIDETKVIMYHGDGVYQYRSDRLYYPSFWDSVDANGGKVRVGTFAWYGGTYEHFKVASYNLWQPSVPSWGTQPFDKTDSTVLLTWNDNDNRGANVSGYTVEHSIDGVDYWVVLLDDAPLTSTEFLVRGLSPNTTYHFRVTKNTDVLNVRSTPVAITTFELSEIPLSDANFYYSSTTALSFANGVLTSVEMSHTLSTTEYTLPLYVECMLKPNMFDGRRIGTDTTIMMTTETLTLNSDFIFRNNPNSIVWGTGSSWNRYVWGVSGQNNMQDINPDNEILTKFSMFVDNNEVIMYQGEGVVKYRFLRVTYPSFWTSVDDNGGKLRVGTHDWATGEYTDFKVASYNPWISKQLAFNSIVIKLNSTMPSYIDWTEIVLRHHSSGSPVAYDVYVNPAFVLHPDSASNAYVSSYPNNALHGDVGGGGGRIIWWMNVEPSPQIGDTLLTLYPKSQVSSMEVIVYDMDVIGYDRHADIEVTYNGAIYNVPKSQRTTQF
jgi:hypothetical protein